MLQNTTKIRTKTQKYTAVQNPNLQYSVMALWTIRAISFVYGQFASCHLYILPVVIHGGFLWLAHLDLGCQRI